MTRFVQSRFPTVHTQEDQHRADFMLFQADGCITAILAMASIAKHLAAETAFMIRHSDSINTRAKYDIITDYTKMRDTVSAADTISKRVMSYNSKHADMITRFSKASDLFGRDKDAGNDLCNRQQVAEEIFRPDYESLRRLMYAKLKPLKCTDPQAFYPLLYALLMAKRFSAMARYISGFCCGFQKQQPLSPLCHLQIQQPLYDLIHRCRFYDKKGNQLLLLLDNEEIDQYLRDSQTRKWQLRHKNESLRPVNVSEYFMSEDILRAAWKMETRMMELRIIDQIILRAEGYDPEYRKDYRMKRIQSCAELYEQAMLNTTIHLGKYSELPTRLRDYIEAYPQYQASVRSKRTTKPVVGFNLNPAKDHQGNIIYEDSPKGSRPKCHFDFIGIWNSAGEASREWSASWVDIQKSIRSHTADSRGTLWMTLDEYLVVLYKSQCQNNPDIAQQLYHLVPGLAALVDADTKRRSTSVSTPVADASSTPAVNGSIHLTKTA